MPTRQRGGVSEVLLDTKQELGNTYILTFELNRRYFIC